MPPESRKQENAKLGEFPTDPELKKMKITGMNGGWQPGEVDHRCERSGVVKTIDVSSGK
jgi:hypothetical protein